MEDKNKKFPQVAGTTSEDKDEEFIDWAIRKQNASLYICFLALVIALASLIITISEFL